MNQKVMLHELRDRIQLIYHECFSSYFKIQHYESPVVANLRNLNAKCHDECLVRTTCRVYSVCDETGRLQMGKHF